MNEIVEMSLNIIEVKISTYREQGKKICCHTLIRILC